MRLDQPATRREPSAMRREPPALRGEPTAMRGGYLSAAAVALLALPALVLPALPAAAAQVDASELARCHAIGAKDERLSCYESLTEAALSATAASTTAPGAPTASTAAPGAHTPGNSAATNSASGTSASGVPATGASVSGAPTAGASSAGTYAPGTSAALAGQPTAGSAGNPARPVDPNDPANFGLSRHQLEVHSSAGSGLPSIKSGVSQITADRNNNITVVLDNGQTWVFIEPEPRLRPGDTVTIKRASLGSFLMLTPSRRSYRVERAK